MGGNLRMYFLQGPWQWNTRKGELLLARSSEKSTLKRRQCLLFAAETYIFKNELVVGFSHSKSGGLSFATETGLTST